MNQNQALTVEQLKQALVEVSNICIRSACNASCPFHEGVSCPMFDSVTPAEWEVEAWMEDVEE